MKENLKVIVFQLNKQKYGVDIEQVLSIEKLENVTEIPKTSDFIKGVMNLRGEITPIVDLQERLELGETTYTDDTRVLIIDLTETQVGIIVDLATDVVDIDPDVIKSPPKMVGGVDNSFLPGIAKLKNDLLILLDLKYILNLDEIQEVQMVIEKIQQEEEE